MGGNTRDVSGLDAKVSQYRLARANDFIIFKPGSRSQFIVTEDELVLVQGAGPDFLLYLTLWITVGEDEKLVVIVDRPSGGCRDVSATPSSGELPLEAADGCIRTRQKENPPRNPGGSVHCLMRSRG